MLLLCKIGDDMVKRYVMLKCIDCGKEIVKPSKTCDGIMCECGGLMRPIKYISHKEKGNTNA